MKLAVKPFTMVGATTRSGLLSSPLRDRFGQHYHLDFYSHDELAQIIQRSAHLRRLSIERGSRATVERGPSPALPSGRAARYSG